MNKIKISILLFFFLGIITGIVSCDDFIEQYPREAVSDEEAFNNIDGIQGAVANLYHRFQQGEYNHRIMNLAGGLLSDQLDMARNNSGYLYRLEINMEGQGFEFWSRLYSDINRANMVLYYIDDVEGSDAIINKAKGEAYAHRGWRYFDLLKVYARPYMYQTPLVQGEPLGVIYKTDPFLGIDESSFQQRGTVDEGYQLVLDDFYNALEYLPLEDGKPYHFTGVSILAALARVYLYMGDWENAADYAESVINDYSFELAENFEDNFIPQPGHESILELAYARSYTPNRFNPTGGYAYMDAETGEGYGDVILRHDLINLLEDYREKGDQRSEMFIYSNKAGQDVAYQTKYTGRHGSYYQDDIKMIRLAEMYLIAAEAYAEMENFPQSRHFLEELRKKRMNEEYAEIDLNTKEELIDLVLTERRVEFFSEQSHRWFDLRRRGMDIPKGVEGIDSGTPLDFDDYRVVERIPNTEVEQNPNCLQNPGY